MLATWRNREMLIQAVRFCQETDTSFETLKKFYFLAKIGGINDPPVRQVTTMQHRPLSVEVSISFVMTITSRSISLLK